MPRLSCICFFGLPFYIFAVGQRHTPRSTHIFSQNTIVPLSLERQKHMASYKAGNITMQDSRTSANTELGWLFLQAARLGR